MTQLYKRQMYGRKVPSSSDVMKTYQTNITSFGGIKNTSVPIEMAPGTFSDAANVYVDENYILSTRKRLTNYKEGSTDITVKQAVVMNDSIFAIVQGDGYAIKYLGSLKNSEQEYELTMPNNALLTENSKLFVVGNKIYITRCTTTNANIFGLYILEFDNTQESYIIRGIDELSYAPEVDITNGKIIGGESLNLFTNKVTDKSVSEHIVASRLAPYDLRNIDNTYAVITNDGYAAKRQKRDVFVDGSNYYVFDVTFSTSETNALFNYTRTLNVEVKRYTLVGIDELQEGDMPDADGTWSHSFTNAYSSALGAAVGGAPKVVEVIALSSDTAVVGIDNYNLNNTLNVGKAELVHLTNFGTSGGVSATESDQLWLSFVGDLCQFARGLNSTLYEVGPIDNETRYFYEWQVSNGVFQRNTTTRRNIFYAHSDDKDPGVGTIRRLRIDKNGYAFLLFSNATYLIKSNATTSCKPLSIPKYYDGLSDAWVFTVTAGNIDDGTDLLDAHLTDVTFDGTNGYLFSVASAESGYNTAVIFSFTEGTYSDATTNVYKLTNAAEKSNITQYRTQADPTYTLNVVANNLVSVLATDAVLIRTLNSNGAVNGIFTANTNTRYYMSNKTPVSTTYVTVEISGEDKTITEEKTFNVFNTRVSIPDYVPTEEGTLVAFNERYYAKPTVILSSSMGEQYLKWANARKNVGYIDGVYAMNNFLIFATSNSYIYSSAFDKAYAPIKNYRPLRDVGEDGDIVDMLVVSPTAALALTKGSSYWLLGEGEGDISAVRPVVSQYTVNGYTHGVTTKLALNDTPTVMYEGGIVGLTDMSEVTETAKNITYLTEPVIQKFASFFDATWVPVMFRDRWFNIFSLTDGVKTKCMLLDCRTNAWWYWTFPVGIMAYARCSEDIFCVDAKGNIYKLTDNIDIVNIDSVEYSDNSNKMARYNDHIKVVETVDDERVLVNKELPILWSIQSHASSCGVPSRGKSLVGCIFIWAHDAALKRSYEVAENGPYTTDADKVDDTYLPKVGKDALDVDFHDYKVNLIITAFDKLNIRDSGCAEVETTIHQLSTMRIRTFVPKFNYITYRLTGSNDKDTFDKLCLTGLTMEFKVLSKLA